MLHFVKFPLSYNIQGFEVAFCKNKHFLTTLQHRIEFCAFKQITYCSDEKIRYFRLTKNRHDAWMEALGRNPNIEHLSCSNSVCSEHFAEEHIIFKNRCVRLKPNAVPTLKLRKPKEYLVENLGYLNR